MPDPRNTPRNDPRNAPRHDPPAPLDENNRASLWVVFLVVFLLAGCAGPLMFIFLMFGM